MKNFTAAGVHVFAGLMTQGVVNAGARVVGIVEHGEFGAKTHRLNFPDIPLYPQPDSWPVDEWREMELDLLFGNPACAAFSAANSERKRTITEPNCGMESMVAFGLRVKPTTFALESVTPLFKDGIPMVEDWEARWKAIGYNTCRLLENGGHLGLPQNRRRAIFLASRLNLDFQYVKCTIPTVLDAIGDLEASPVVEPTKDGHTCLCPPISYAGSPKTEYQAMMRAGNGPLTWHTPRKPTEALAAILPHLQQDKRFDSIPDEVFEKTYWPARKKIQRADGKGKPGLLHRRLAWDKPCAVLTGAAMYFHPTQHRFLTVREQARLMGVPDHFNFAVRNVNDAYAEIGKAVSPIVGQWLTSELMRLTETPSTIHHTHIDLIH